jgi:hypothetical protein
MKNACRRPTLCPIVALPAVDASLSNLANSS